MSGVSLFRELDKIMVKTQQTQTLKLYEKLQFKYKETHILPFSTEEADILYSWFLFYDHDFNLSM